MALKIERVWSNLFGTQKVNPQHDRQHKNEQQKDQQKENDEQSKQQAQDERAKDREQVEKAAKELRESQNFQNTGMHVEVFAQFDGIKVRLSQKGGNTVKIMTAEEFLKLKDNTTKDTTRGKILDQKF